MRTKPAGAVASGDTNVRPSSDTSWKNTSVRSATTTAAHAVVSVKPFGGRAVSGLRLIVGLRGSRGREPRLDLGHHARRQCVPIMSAGEHAAARRVRGGVERRGERSLHLRRAGG